MRAHSISAPLGLACIFTLSLAACVSGSTDGSSGPGGGASGNFAQLAGTSAGGLAAGGNAGSMPLGGAQPGAGNNAGGTIIGTAGAGPGGVGTGGIGTGGTMGVAGNGQGGMPSGAPQGVTITTHDLAVPSGKVFNVADDYFNDGFIPPTPVANFGCQSQITVHQNDDGSLDVGWLDYSGGAGKPWAVPSPAMINVTHIDAGLTTATTTPTGINTYKLLGFDKDPAGNAYVAYNKDHSLKGSGGENNLDGNELHVAKVGGWDTLIFGNQNNNDDGTPGDPGGAASGVLGYDPMNQKIMIYLGHSMMWTPIRHQAGFLRLVNPSTGAVINPSSTDLHFGASWWYSHNFNQRMIIDGGNFYVLAHGDAYSRTLGFARWSVNGYTGKNDTDFNESYFDIAGNEGDNNTNAQTGQFTRISPDQFAIVHTTSQDRSARDVRIVAASASNGRADGAKAVWVTTNQGTVQATMPKLEMLGDKILVTYALWDSSKKHNLTWYATLLDASFATVTKPEVLQNVEFVDSAPLFRFKGGPNAGQVGWVSGNASHTLSVHVASVRY